MLFGFYKGDILLVIPNVLGVIATILSEFPEIQFNCQSMLEFLNKISLKDIIEGLPEGVPNVFLNNGNNLIYLNEIEDEENTPLSIPISNELITDNAVYSDDEEFAEIEEITSIISVKNELNSESDIENDLNN